MQTLYASWAYAAWVFMGIIWLLGSLRTKRTVRRPEIGKYLITSLLASTGFLLLFLPHIRGPLGMMILPQTPLLGIAGVLLTYAGAAFATWARITLGSNWSGATATIKRDHELIQSGPYAMVRHPIYTGLLLAVLGTALTLGNLAGIVSIVLCSIGFLMRIPTEEAAMTVQFPDAYPAYRRRTKALIPFVL